MLYKDKSINFHKISRKLKKVFAKQSQNAKVHEMRARMGQLVNDLKNTIFIDLAEIRRQEALGCRNTRAEARLKNAYTALFMLERGKAELEENVSDEQLARLINQTTQIMMKLNHSTLFAPEIGTEFFNWQADVLEGSAEADPDCTLNISKTQQNTITRDIITRLKNNNSLDSCLANDWNTVNPNVIRDDAPAEFFTEEDISRLANSDPDRGAAVVGDPDLVPNLGDEESAARFQEIQQKFNL